MSLNKKQPSKTKLKKVSACLRFFEFEFTPSDFLLNEYACHVVEVFSSEIKTREHSQFCYLTKGKKDKFILPPPPGQKEPKLPQLEFELTLPIPSALKEVTL